MVEDHLSNIIDHTVKPNIATAVRTLTAGGFILKGAERKPGYSLLYFSRFDEFGSVQKYCFVLTNNNLSVCQYKGAKIAADHYQSQLVIIGHVDGQPKIEWDRFINLFGGPVLDTSPFDPHFTEKLVMLGHNELPPNMQGRPDELFELYVHTALEFILGGCVIRYGQARRFESKPDGLAIPNPSFSALYDTKASKDGYELTNDSIRQFKSYIEDFHNCYSSYYQLNFFIVISGKFMNHESTLVKRSQELMAETRTPLVFLDAVSLTKILNLLTEYPLMRRSIKWLRVFSEIIVKPDIVKKEIARIQKDRIIRS